MPSPTLLPAPPSVPPNKQTWVQRQQARESDGERASVCERERERVCVGEREGGKAVFMHEKGSVVAATPLSSEETTTHKVLIVLQERRGQNLAFTVLFVPSLLKIGGC